MMGHIHTDEAMAELLITGGAGFIGSHTSLCLLQDGHHLLVFDDFSNSSHLAINRVRQLAGKEAASRLQLMEGDIRSSAQLDKAFATRRSKIDAVIHFAGLKSVGESTLMPLSYWDVNVNGSRCLLDTMHRHGCKTLVFSSTATIYGFPDAIPIPEDAPIKPINPYGHTKAAVEQMLADVQASAPDEWRIACLRYFNPVGAHPSGLIGENPLGKPNNLFPYICQVAGGLRPQVQVFGDDWPTPDGTGVRDYIHIQDLAEGHRAALNCLLDESPQRLTLNLGSGKGISVLEMLRGMESAAGRSIPYQITERRNGDAAASVADPNMAEERLGWRTQRDLSEICRDGWAWQSQNPNGYE